MVLPIHGKDTFRTHDSHTWRMKTYREFIHCNLQAKLIVSICCKPNFCS